MMNVKEVAVLLLTAGLLGGVNTTAAQAEVKPETILSEPTPKVKALIEKYKLEVVDTSYVKKRLGEGTRVSATAVIIDARPPKKYILGHVPTAINIPDTRFDKFHSQIADLDKKSELITYCGGWKCAKSPKLAGMLQAKGFTNVKVYQSGYPSWKKGGNYAEVDTTFVKSAVKKANAVIIDVRPKKKFTASHISGAINIPDTRMESMLGQLPKDKAQKIITYCDGYKCAKSHKVAKKLLGMGYTNVAVYSASQPVWEKEGLSTEGKKAQKAAAATKAYLDQHGVQLVKDQEENQGMVYGPWYLEIIKTLPANIVLVDVRGSDDFQSGHIPGAINIPFTDKDTKGFMKKLMALKKTVIMNCGAGAVATECMLAVIENKGDQNKIFYVDANLDCNKNNECSIEINDPL